MAASKAILTWSRLRWILVACWLAVEARVFIPDYPYDVPFWKVAIWDANGWLHEAFYIAVGFLVLIDITYHWENRKRVYIIRRTVREPRPPQ